MKDPIDILLKEYDALRAEILGRNNHQFQLMAIVAAALTWLSSRRIDATFFIALTIIVLGTTIFGTLMWRDVFRASARLQELETEINGLCGRNLLTWETSWSAGSRGWFGWITGWSLKLRKPN